MIIAVIIVLFLVGAVGFFVVLPNWHVKNLIHQNLAKLAHYSREDRDKALIAQAINSKKGRRNYRDHVERQFDLQYFRHACEYRQNIPLMHMARLLYNEMIHPFSYYVDINIIKAESGMSEEEIRENNRNSFR